MAPMDHDRFVRFVKLSASIPGDEAERVIGSTLQALAERLTKDEATELAAQLPEDLVPYVAANVHGQAFDADELLLRAAAPEGQIRAVMNALRRAVGDDEWSNVAAELGPDYGSLLAPVDGLAAHEFVARVGSSLATEAVLETLAERVSGDAVEDLISQLPIELRAPLRRGKPDRDTRAERMTIEAFAERVARRAGTTVDEAVAHARVVFAVLHDALHEGDFYNLIAQLPLDYSVLLPRP